MMDRKYLITRMDGSIYSFLTDGQRAIEIHCDPAEVAKHALDSIYIGKIKNIAKNIGAAFVEIAPGVVCHLALDDMKCPVYTKKGASELPQAGDELLVQISREGMKTKYPSVTTRLTMHGKYVLLTIGTDKNSASSKLSKAEKERMLSIAAGMYAPKARRGLTEQKYASPGLPCEVKYSWLFRTNAGGVSDEMLVRDMERIYTECEALLTGARYRTCFSCLHEAPSAYLRRLMNLYDSEVEQVLTDDELLYREIKSYLVEHQPEDVDRLSFYQDDLLPMKKLYSLESQLSQALQERVWLKSGGYLIIQPTEALTVIDVNTGKFEGGKKKETAFLKINCEAAVEIARQLRLRNLNGIIIVDFINMEEEASKAALLSEFDAQLRRDPIRTTLVDMTKLSLVEVTRQKRERPLAECVAQGGFGNHHTPHSY